MQQASGILFILCFAFLRVTQHICDREVILCVAVLLKYIVFFHVGCDWII